MPFPIGTTDSRALLDSDFTNLTVHSRGGIYWKAIDPTGVGSYDMGPSVEGVSFSESYREAARRVEVDTNPGVLGLPATHLGSTVAIYGREFTPTGPSPKKRIFQGTVFDDQRSYSGSTTSRTYVVYDPLTVLARNEGHAVYRGKSLAQIFEAVCSVRGIPKGVVDSASRHGDLGQIVQQPGMTDWDVLTEARRRHSDKFGQHFIIRWNEDTHAADILGLGRTGVTWKIRDDSTMLTGDFNESAEALRQRVQVIAEEYDDPGSTDDLPHSRLIIRATAALNPNDELVRWFGYMTKAVPPINDDQTTLKSRDQAKSQLRQAARTIKRMTTSCLLIPGLRRGDSFSIQGASVTLDYGTWYADSVVAEYREGVMTQTIDLLLDEQDFEAD